MHKGQQIFNERIHDTISPIMFLNPIPYAMKFKINNVRGWKRERLSLKTKVKIKRLPPTRLAALPPE